MALGHNFYTRKYTHISYAEHQKRHCNCQIQNKWNRQQQTYVKCDNTENLRVMKINTKPTKPLYLKGFVAEANLIESDLEGALNELNTYLVTTYNKLMDEKYFEPQEKSQSLFYSHFVPDFYQQIYQSNKANWFFADWDDKSLAFNKKTYPGWAESDGAIKRYNRLPKTIQTHQQNVEKFIGKILRDCTYPRKLYVVGSSLIINNHRKQELNTEDTETKDNDESFAIYSQNKHYDAPYQGVPFVILLSGSYKASPIKNKTISMRAGISLFVYIFI